MPSSYVCGGRSVIIIPTLAPFTITYGVGFGEWNLLVEQIGHRLMIEKVDFNRIIQVHKRLHEYPLLSTTVYLLIYLFSFDFQ